MKIWEILKEENVGKVYEIYIGRINEGKITINLDEWGVPQAEYVKSGKRLNDVFTLHGILKFEFTEVIDWSKVPVDTKILVRGLGKAEWKKRYFAKYENNTVYTWADGRTSWSTNSAEYDIVGWEYAKLYKEGEE